MLAFVIASALAGQLVSYVDEQGTTHYVDAPSKIPAKYRKKAKPLEGEVGTVEQQKPKDTRQPNSVQIEPASIREQQKEQQRLREQQNRANAKPAAVDANSPEERRRRWEEAKTRGPEVKEYHHQNGRTAADVKYTGADGLKPAESCHQWGASCAVPPECCSNNCNAKTFKCE